MNGFRGTITRKMNSAVDEIGEAFGSLYGVGYVNKNDALLCLDELREAGKLSSRPSILRRLFDILDACGVSYERGMDNGYYESLVKNAPMPSFDEVERRLLCAMFELYRKYPTPEKYLERLVDTLGTDKEDASLRLKILRQAVRCGSFSYTTELTCGGEAKTKKVTIYGGELYLRKYLGEKLGKKPKSAAEHAMLIDEDVFGVLETASAEQKKPGGPYGMLQMINDLASGQLRTCGATKKALYLFAMLYKMTFPTSSGIADPETDVETKLFSDYYTFNLLRFISDSYSGIKAEYETDPTGGGINYKNYAELSYLYFIAKPEMTAEEKIKRSDELISRLPEMQRARIEEDGDSRPAPRETKFYRDAVKPAGENIFAEDILELDENSFTEFLLSFCDCSRSAKYSSVMQSASEQNTAYREYIKLIGMLLDAVRAEYADVEAESDIPSEVSEEAMKYLRKNLRYGLWFADLYGTDSVKTVDGKKRLAEAVMNSAADADEKSVRDYVTLLTEAGEFLTDAFSVTSPANVTRTSIVAAYYYYYNTLHENDGRWSRGSFANVLREYREGLDPILRACNLRELNAKNLFDVLIVFSSYAYLNL